MLAEKDKKGKPSYAEIPFKTVLNAMSKVREYGSTKYSADNRFKKITNNDLLDSLIRHIAEYKEGVNNDSESGLPHLYHILYNAALLVDAHTNDVLIDDRVNQKFVEAEKKESSIESRPSYSSYMGNQVINDFY